MLQLCLSGHLIMCFTTAGIDSNATTEQSSDDNVSKPCGMLCICSVYTDEIYSNWHDKSLEQL